MKWVMSTGLSAAGSGGGGGRRRQRADGAECPAMQISFNLACHTHLGQLQRRRWPGREFAMGAAVQGQLLPLPWPA